MASPSAEFIHAALRSLSNRIESVNQTWQGDDVEIRHQQEALRSELGRLQVPSLPSSVPWSPLQSARHVLSGVLGFNRRRKTQRRCTQPSWSRISRLRLSGTPSAPTPISSAQTFGKLAKGSRPSWLRCATRFSHAQLTLSVSSCLAGCITLSVRVIVLCLCLLLTCSPCVRSTECGPFVHPAVVRIRSLCALDLQVQLVADTASEQRKQIKADLQFQAEMRERENRTALTSKTDVSSIPCFSGCSRPSPHLRTSHLSHWVSATLSGSVAAALSSTPRLSVPVS